MKIQRIVYNKVLRHEAFWQIVEEYEEIFANELKVEFVSQHPSRLACYVGKINRKLLNLFPPYSLSFGFEQTPWKNCVQWNNKRYIPNIVDFFATEPEELNRFYEDCSNHLITLVSSKEVYDFLQSKECPIKIAHLGLSLSDKYKISPNTSFVKKFDVALLGRHSNVMKQWLSIFHQRYPELSIITTTRVGENFHAIDECGKFVADVTSRQNYLSVIKKCRIALYCTPSMDGGEKRAKGFNQVTPKFLEYLACGCHVLTRYKQNSDTVFYEFDKYWPSIDTYEDFEREMNKALSTEVDMQFYSNYLSKHYTSVRVAQLKDILKNL